MTQGSGNGYEIGVDIGGTFTDIVACGGPDGRLVSAKVLTDYQDLARGVLKGVRAILADHGIDPARVTRIVHGTTLVTNSLIERRGARTALLVTAGFGDLLELGRESRFDIYDIDIDMPRPLLTRDQVFELPERMNHRGGVITPLDEAALARLVPALAAFRSIAVCLLHAYANPAHERRVAALLRAALPGADVCLSCDVLADAREYERASTTVANAYVRPVMTAYLNTLAAALRELGIGAQLLIMTSDGGLVDVQAAATYPVRLIESGPAGGASAAAHVARGARLPHLIAYDMGGTTAKICLIEDGAPLRADQFEFGRSQRFARGSGLPLQIPVVEMIEIGAGGGSIARINDIGMLQIGPESANAAPGPACYGLGGSGATVTDADLVLGYVSADSFLGGSMRLSVAAARAAIEQTVARPLGMSVEEAAWSIHRVVNANMARAAKVHCLEQGKDARAFELFAYGGAGPIHAWGVARILGARGLYFPLRAGVLSAFGFLVAEPTFEIVRGRIEPLLEADPAALEDLLARLAEEAIGVVRASVPAGSACAVSREVAVRFEGQSFELGIPVPDGALDREALAAVGRAFVARYRERYHAEVEHGALQTVRWRVRARALDGRVPPRLGGDARAEGGAPEQARKGSRPVWLEAARGLRDCPVYDRHGLAPGARIVGLAIFEEAESTVYIGAEGVATVAADGALRVSIEGVPA